MGINTEEWLTKKKGQYFQSWVERADIIRHLNMVDVVTVPDDEVGSACGAIAKCLEVETVVFCNGGDRSSSNTQELDMYGNDPKFNLNLVLEVLTKKIVVLGFSGYFDRQRKLLGI